MITIDDLEFRCTCSACPEQYDVYYCGKKVAYIRYRWGCMVSYPYDGDRLDFRTVIYEWSGGDGWSGSVYTSYEVEAFERCKLEIVDYMNKSVRVGVIMEEKKKSINQKEVHEIVLREIEKKLPGVAEVTTDMLEGLEDNFGINRDFVVLKCVETCFDELRGRVRGEFFREVEKEHGDVLSVLFRYGFSMDDVKRLYDLLNQLGEVFVEQEK